MENEATDISRIGFNLIWKSIQARVWKYGAWKITNVLKTMFRPVFDFSK